MFNSKFAPPPSSRRARVNARKILIFILVALGLFSAAPALAQTDEPNELIDLELAAAGPDCLWISYKHYPGTSARIYQLYLRPTTQVDYLNWETDATIAPFISTPGVIKFTDLQSDLSHEVIVQMENIPGESSTHYATHYFNTGAAGSLPCGYVPKKKKPKATPTPMPTARPLVNTCPDLLPDIVISGYVSYGSQCQVIDAGGVGRMDLIERGIVAAVDIWSWVPSGVQVCFRAMGAEMVFLDAAYSPRMLMPLEHTVREGHSCAAIDTAGTVVLLAS